MFTLRAIDSLSTTTRGKYLQAALNRPQGPHPPAKSICVGTRKGENLVRNINNVGCGTLENRKERWRREFANFLMSNDPHLPEILIWRNQFFTSNVRGKDLVRNINTECSIEYIWRRGNNVESARVNFLDLDDPYPQSQNIFCGTHQGHTFLVKSVKILDREQNWIKYSGKETVHILQLQSSLKTFWH